mgnify:CR=1 FL=1
MFFKRSEKRQLSLEILMNIIKANAFFERRKTLTFNYLQNIIFNKNKDALIRSFLLKSNNVYVHYNRSVFNSTIITYAFIEIMQ